MPAPDAIKKLIARFEEHRDRYMSPDYNETQLRREFLDPFFEALGWDVQNKKGFAEPWKEVVHEDSIQIDGVAKAPDYSFRLGGKRLFFLEAKKPSINIKEDSASAYQLRRYGWTAKLPVSILSDFEEFAVYDTRVKPDQKDKAHTARVLYIPYTEYLEKWDFLHGLFSPEAIQHGALEKYTESNKKKRGTAEVDDDFLAEIEEWRDILAKSIALRNKDISQRDLNYAVQITIDRIIFLRICEDRGIESYAQLMALQNGTDVYARLRVLYDRADERYNSGLFHFNNEKNRSGSPDTLTPKLQIDDKTLKSILKRLYYPECPYQFSVFPAEILGHVYERFLGSVIRLTSSGQAKVEQKPEVRKAGGVYYTPSYIVDYIVKHTVGKLLEGKMPQEVAGMTSTWKAAKGAHPLTILDPACGSGSFLLGAYQYLLDWHLEQYLKDSEQWCKGKNPRIYKHHKGNEYRLTTAERKRILLANIYGVDIDTQAVEVTKLSLLLKVLEGVDAEVLQHQLNLFHERALPDLSDNIKCGNSLIGPDFYQGKQMDAFDEEETYHINAFDWYTEFKEIMKAGGFDAVIGNPPYVRQEGLGEFKEYFLRNYKTYAGTADLFVPFIERGVSLLGKGGYFSYIVANKWMRANYGAGLRAWLQKQCIEEIVDFGDLPVFNKATTYPCIIRIVNQEPQKNMLAVNMDSLDFTELDEHVAPQRFSIAVKSLADTGWTLVRRDVRALLQKIKGAGIPLGEYVGDQIYRGVLTGLNEAFVIDVETRDKLISEDPKSAKLIKPFLAGRDIKRYVPPKADRYLIFTRRGVDIKNYPAIHEYLLPFKQQLMPKPKGRKGAWKGRKPGPYEWYEIQDTIGYFKEFEKPKIILPDISLRGNFTLDKSGGCYCVNTAYIIASDDKYLLGILNSKLMTFVYRDLSSTYRGGYLRYIYQYLVQLAIRPIDRNSKKQSQQMIGLVERMLESQNKLQTAKTPSSKILIQRHIDSTDAEIDKLVYELYGLTEEEVRIVEGTISK